MHVAKCDLVHVAICDIVHVAIRKQELSHDSIARLNCALPITKTISVIR